MATILGTLGNAARNIAVKTLQNTFGSPQDVNNAYSRAEMQFANDLEQSNAREANRIAQENADIAFERQKYFNDVAMEFNATEAEKARAYDERMSNTAYQRAMADMKAAGLNPILAYSQGGAAVTGGQAASIGSSSASQAQAYTAGVQRQVIDNRSDTEIRQSYLKVASNLFTTFMNNATSVANSFISSAGDALTKSKGGSTS